MESDGEREGGKLLSDLPGLLYKRLFNSYTRCAVTQAMVLPTWRTIGSPQVRDNFC